MPYLIAAVTLVGALSVMNLVLILALARRMRTAGPDPVRDVRSVALVPGQRPARFTATALDGEAAGDDALQGGAVGFFSAGCAACLVQAPAFVDYARAAGLPRSAVLAVLAGDAEETAPLAATLGGAARLVVEPLEGPLYQAFSVRGLPAMMRFDRAGVVVASSAATADLPVGVAAANP